MAEGGAIQKSYHASFSKASGEADELFCDPCKGANKWTAVEGYCTVCDEYMCDTCLGVHRQLKITKSHTIQGKAQMPRGQRQTSTKDMCVDVCKTHHPEIIRFYCETHDIPGCGDCMTLEHKECERKRVQDISDDFTKTEEFTNMKQRLQNLHQELEMLQGCLDDDLNNIGENYAQLLDKIKSVREQVNDYLDLIQKQITDEVTKLKKDEENELTDFISKNKALKVELNNMLDSLHTANANTNSIFVNTKLAKTRIVTMETEIQKMQQSQQHIYDFQISDEFAKMISNKAPLGELVKQPTKTRSIPVKSSQSKNTPTDITAKYHKTINAKCLTNRKTCRFIDSVILSENRMVVVDEVNNNIKLIDMNMNTVVSTFSNCKCHHYIPYGVTALSSNMIAVTICTRGEGTVQLLNVTTKLSLEREINIWGPCQCIAYKDDKLAVTYEYAAIVDILNLQGKQLHRIEPPKGSNILGTPFYIIFGIEKDTLIISDSSKNKVCMVSFGGEILRSFTRDALIFPQGIALTEDGVLFVCSRENGTIHAVSPDFETSEILIINKKRPQSISYCKTRHALYISNSSVCSDKDDMTNQIQVYKLNSKKLQQ